MYGGSGAGGGGGGIGGNDGVGIGVDTGYGCCEGMAENAPALFSGVADASSELRGEQDCMLKYQVRNRGMTMTIGFRYSSLQNLARPGNI